MSAYIYIIGRKQPFEISEEQRDVIEDNIDHLKKIILPDKTMIMTSSIVSIENSKRDNRSESEKYDRRGLPPISEDYKWQNNELGSNPTEEGIKKIHEENMKFKQMLAERKFQNGR